MKNISGRDLVNTDLVKFIKTPIEISIFHIPQNIGFIVYKLFYRLDDQKFHIESELKTVKEIVYESSSISDIIKKYNELRKYKKWYE